MSRIFCDGSGFNGNISKFGFLVEKGHHSSMIFFDNPALTNNVMEYSAILMAAVIASQGDEILSDSQLAVKQIKGEWKIKEPSLFPLRLAASALIQGKNLKLTWIPREQNKADKIV